MRTLLALTASLLLTAPALAAPAAEEDEYKIPSELTDPAMAGTIAKALSAMTKAMLDMPVGGMQAAVEGREPSAAERQRTMRDMAGRDPNLERKIEGQIAVAVPRLQAGMKAMASSLPSMMKALEKVADEMEGSLDKASANLPQPGYPKR